MLGRDDLLRREVDGHPSQKARRTSPPGTKRKNRSPRVRPTFRGCRENRSRRGIARSPSPRIGRKNARHRNGKRSSSRVFRLRSTLLSRFRQTRAETPSEPRATRLRRCSGANAFRSMRLAARSARGFGEGSSKPRASKPSSVDTESLPTNLSARGYLRPKLWEVVWSVSPNDSQSSWLFFGSKLDLFCPYLSTKAVKSRGEARNVVARKRSITSAESSRPRSAATARTPSVPITSSARWLASSGRLGRRLAVGRRAGPAPT